MAAPTDSGIYEIVNLTNGKRYVGSALNFARRWRQHRSELGKGRHNPHLQSAWKKYGPDAFEFRIIELVADAAGLLRREQHWIDTLNPEYNCAPVAGSNLGVEWTAETKAKMAVANKAIWARPGHRQKMSDAHRGGALTEEHKAKIGDALRGKPLSRDHGAKVAAQNAARNKSPEHRALMSAYWSGRPKTPEQIEMMAATKRGQALSDEHKAKVSNALLQAYAEGRRKREKSPEHRAKIASALKGRKLSEERVAKARGRRATPETRRKMAEAQRNRWAERKAAGNT